MSYANLIKMLAQADHHDRSEGRLAYDRYRSVMIEFADFYGHPLDRTTAAFCALSPNNDYRGNLRSLASVLSGHSKGVDPERITVSTYNHCKDRALGYLDGEPFLTTKRGLKIASFYRNIMDPSDPEPVTIDGHMIAAWRGQDLVMRDAIPSGRKEYNEVAEAVRQIALAMGLVANQVQATIWFTRKRVKEVVYDPQISLFGDKTDLWEAFVVPRDALPYPLKEN